MSQFNFADLIKQAGASFEPLAAGPYEAIIQKADAVRTSTGKTMFKLTWSITQGPFTNRKVWSNQVISPESPPALGIFFRQMAALGLDNTFFAANPSPDQVAQALVNRPAQIVVAQREYQGQLRNDVTDIKQSSGGAVGGAAMGGFPPPVIQQQVPGIPQVAAPQPGYAPQPEPPQQQPQPDPWAAGQQQQQVPQQQAPQYAPQQPVQQAPQQMQMQIPQPTVDPGQVQSAAGPVQQAAPPLPF